MADIVKQETPLVVIWCLIYNQKKYIRNTLDGFLMQETKFPIEIIVHDDLSTDGTTDIVKEYCVKYPNIFIHIIEKENQWSKGGLKTIIELMNSNFRKGKYIAICEGDDYWTDPQKLQKQVDFLESHPSYSMCFHSAKKKYETDAIAWIDCEHIKDKDYDATDLFINWTVPTASMLFRKEAMDFYANLKGPNRIQNYDIFIILSCAMTGKIRGMSSQMSVYRIQGGGLTYNKAALLKCTMNNPDHFQCLKENFPIVESKYVNHTISKTFFERSLIQPTFCARLSDMYSSFVYDYKCFFYYMFRSIMKLPKSIIYG